MLRGVRGFLFLSSLGVVLFAFLTLGLYMNRVERRYVNDLLLTEELREVRLAAHLFPIDLLSESRRERLDAWADSLGAIISRRVTIVDTAGVVLGDSEVPLDSLLAVENHGGRPEVRAARAGRQGTDVRRSGTVHREFVYAAVPIRRDGRVLGVLRLANPTTQTTAAWRRAVGILYAGIGVALLVTILVAAIGASLLTRRLREITTAADRLGQGEMDLRVPRGGPSEIDRLSRVMNDMSDRLRARMGDLEAERNHLGAILGTMEPAVVVVDHKGRIRLANRSFSSLAGSQGNVVGRPLAEVARQFPLHELVALTGETGEPIRRELSFLSPEPRHLEAHSVAIPPGQPHPEEVLVVLHDVTGLRRLEALRRDFVANVSHELRTPLTVIRGFAETLLDGALEDSSQRRQFVERIEVQARRLGALVEDLLTLADIERPETAFDLRPTDLGEVARTVAREFEVEATRRRLELVIDLPASLPRVEADASRLAEVLRNLLDNALKYTTGGTVTLRAGARGGVVEVAVSDTGIGIPASDLPRIFERFYRVDRNRSRETGGTGLGLSIVKHIVEKHGGTVRAESSPGRGTTIFFTLPVAGA